MASKPASQVAAILCNDCNFADFIRITYEFRGSAQAYIQGHCDIVSRKELDFDVIAQRKFYALKNAYDAWRGFIAAPR